jgi:hypothetical protein
MPENKPSKITVSVRGKIELTDMTDTNEVKVWVFDNIHYSMSYEEVTDLLVWLYEMTGSPVIDTALYLIWRKELTDEEKEKVRKIRTLYLAFLDGKIEPIMDISKVYAALVENKLNSSVFEAMRWLYRKTGAEKLLDAYNRVVSYRDLNENEREYILLIEKLLFEYSNIHYCEEIYRKIRK